MKLFLLGLVLLTVTGCESEMRRNSLITCPMDHLRKIPRTVLAHEVYYSDPWTGTLRAYTLPTYVEYKWVCMQEK